MKYSKVSFLIFGLIVPGADIAAKPNGNPSFYELVMGCLGDCARPFRMVMARNEYAYKKNDDTRNYLINDEVDHSDLLAIQRAMQQSLEDWEKKNLVHVRPSDQVIKSVKTGSACGVICLEEYKNFKNNVRQRKHEQEENSQLETIQLELDAVNIEFHNNPCFDSHQNIRNVELKIAILEGMPELEEVS